MVVTLSLNLLRRNLNIFLTIFDLEILSLKLKQEFTISLSLVYNLDNVLSSLISILSNLVINICNLDNFKVKVLLVSYCSMSL